MKEGQPEMIYRRNQGMQDLGMTGIKMKVADIEKTGLIETETKGLMRKQKKMKTTIRLEKKR